MGSAARGLQHAAKGWYPWRAVLRRHWGGMTADQIADCFLGKLPVPQPALPGSEAEVPPGVQGRDWAVQTAPGVCSAAALLTSLGQYRAAEALLMRALGERGGGAQDGDSDGGSFPEEMEASAMLFVARSNAVARLSPDHAQAVYASLLALAKVRATPTRLRPRPPRPTQPARPSGRRRPPRVKPLLLLHAPGGRPRGRGRSGLLTRTLTRPAPCAPRRPHRSPLAVPIAPPPSRAAPAHPYSAPAACRVTREARTPPRPLPPVLTGHASSLLPY